MNTGLHHVEIWVADLEEGREVWGWLLERLGWSVEQVWPDGLSWRDGDTYVVVTRPPRLSGAVHDRRLPGVNHLAFHGGSTEDVDRLVRAGPEHGWSLLYADRYPHAGGAEHYAAYLQNRAGFKVEVVADVVLA